MKKALIYKKNGDDILVITLNLQGSVNLAKVTISYKNSLEYFLS